MTRRARPALLATLVVPVAARALAACVVAQPAPAVTPSPSSGAVAPAHAVAYNAPPPVVAATGCSLTLSVATVTTRAGCSIDQRVSSQSTTVTYPCEGGPAQARFADAIFDGTVSADGLVELSLRTTFTFTDRCQWETKQEIRGQLQTGSLAYTYSEHPLPGQSGCAARCDAAAAVSVTRP